MPSPTWIYILLVVLLLLIVGIIFLYVVIKKSRQSPAPKGATAELVAADDEQDEAQAAQVGPYASHVGLRLSFSKAMRRISAYSSGTDSRYRVPWYLMIGEAQSGKTTLLGNTGLNLLFDGPRENRGGVKQGVNWFFFDQGIVLDVAGDYVLRADGETSNGKGWAALTGLLRRHRPERPLDGIILTIPCTDLMGGPNLSPERKLKLEQKAHYLYKKLLAAQKTLGMNFPVYVLITKCDCVTGFKSLCHEIPERRNEMFGWSSPYTREIAYRVEWVTEAFQNLYRYLFQLQIEVFAERDEVENSDELFMLPTEMRAMQQPLQVYLDHIFKESAYHDSFFLRGIYFCGDSTGEAPVSTFSPHAVEPEIDWLMPPPNPSRVIAPDQTAAAAGRRPVFLAHLFERKIFQEELLARPVNRTVLSRNRMVLVAQLLSLAIPLIGILGILATYPGLKEREKEFYKFLTNEERDLKAIKAEKESGLTGSRAQNREDALTATKIEKETVATDGTAQNREARLFEAMSGMSGKGLNSLFVPTSWFSDVNERSGKSISDAYHYVVFESLRRQLDCRTENKLLPLPSSAGCYATLATVADQPRASNNCVFEGDPSSVPVHTFIESLGELMQNRTLYERLIKDDSGNVNDLNKLLVYLNHAPLPGNFDTNNKLFAQALKTVRGAPLQSSDADVYDRGACKVEGMIEEIYGKTFENRSVRYVYLSDITKAEALLSKPEYAWLANRTFIEPTPFGGLTISAGLSELKRALKDLSKQKFMSGDSTQESAPQPEQHHQVRRVIIWDKEPLQQAINLAQDYADFIKSNSYQNPETLDRSVKQAAINSLTRKIAVLVAQAQRALPSQRILGESASRANLAAEITSLTEAQPLITKLLDMCNKIGIDVGLRGRVMRQTVALMQVIDAEFTSGQFYAMTQEGFYWWKLDKAFHSYTAFGASNADELEVYLATQRNGIAELGRQYAAPVLNFMSALRIQRVGSVDWNQILIQLDKYENQKPGSTVGLLENFIRVEMDKVSLTDCPALLADSSLQYGDYFIQVRNSLRQSLYQRCEQLAGEKIARDDQLAREQKRREFEQSLKSYTEIEETFNKTLAGKFPFSVVPQVEPFGEADPNTINAFFQLLAKNKDVATKALKESPQYGYQPDAALDFLDRMEEVRKFFSFLDTNPAYPTFNFNLGFRVNEQMEVGANQIITWELAVGKKKFRYPGTDTAGSWGYTEPLVLSLRWADDSPSIPSSNFSTASRMKVNAKTVTVVYNNNWSLLLLLLQHKGRETDFYQGVDIEPYTLNFTVPTQPNAAFPNFILRAQPRSLLANPVVAYMRVSLLAPSKKDPLKLPEPFPTDAPKLPNKNQSTYQSTEQE